MLAASDETWFRVFDTPGFAGTDTRKPVHLTNLQVLSSVIKTQNLHRAHFRRILYFLPWRGKPLRADRNFREELEAISYYFGPKNFNSTIFIASKDDDEQETPLFPRHEDATKNVVGKALRTVAGELKILPAVVYLPYNSTPNEVQEMVHEKYSSTI